MNKEQILKDLKDIEQAESYDIQRDIIDSYNIKKSYKGFDLLKVALLNLV